MLGVRYVLVRAEKRDDGGRFTLIVQNGTGKSFQSRNDVAIDPRRPLTTYSADQFVNLTFGKRTSLELLSRALI